MRPDSITLAIEEKYSPEQKAEIAQKLAAAIAEQETIQGEKKASDAVFNGRLKSKDDDISELAKKYNKGCEVKQVECKIRYNVPEPGKKSLYRVATEELVEVRDMTIEEKQENLQFPLPTDQSKKSKPKPTEPVPVPAKPTEITLRYIQDVAATIVTLPPSDQSHAIKEMAEKIAPLLLQQGKIADRNGNLEVITTLEGAQDLANAWLTGCTMAAGDDSQTNAAGA